MRAIVIEEGRLVAREVPAPEAGPGQVRIRVRAAGVNRADVLQRKGRYPAPPDAPADIPGLELAGEVDAVGPGVLDRKVGDRVFGVVSGGAYAEHVVVHARAVAPMPEGLDFTEAAAIPEAFLTAYDAMVLQAGLAAGERVLIHAVGSGVGTAAVQIARAIGATSVGTARTEEKLGRAVAMGLGHGVLVSGAPAFARDVGGVDVVLDLVGGDYVGESLRALNEKGRIVLVGLLAGARTELDLGLVLRRRLRIFGTVLRARPLEEKIAAAQVLARNLAPLVAQKVLAPVLDRTFPLEAAADAHAHMEADASFGKLVLEVP